MVTFDGISLNIMLTKRGSLIQAFLYRNLPEKVTSRIKCLALEEKRIGAVSLEPILCSEFLREYKKKLKDDILPLEFKALSRLDEDYPQLIGNLPCNFQKNNNRTIIPYDHSRVCLETTPNMVDMDYINASFIYRMQGNKKVKAYIAAQGPVATTVSDFWRMIWQEGVSTVVMLNNIFCYSKQECEKYWHPVYSMYGDIHVRQDSVATTCHYTVRTFTISKVGLQKERRLTHFQFHTWIEQEIPDALAVLEFQRKVKHWYTSSGSKAPILVHCGNGAGRTGAYITLDIVLDNIRDRGTVDILSTIKNVRKMRPSMVNHLNQFKFLYEAICMLFTCGMTVVKVGELKSLVPHMARRDSSTKMSGFEREYKILHEVTPKLTIGDCAGGHRAENRKKSRDIMIQPPERARPYLMTFDSSDSSDFINAVYSNGYNSSNEFVITQWPLKKTCNDLWRLIFDAHITSVVVLHDTSTSRNFPEFWPKKEGVKERYGPVCSTLLQNEHTQSLVIKTFNVKKVFRTDLLEINSDELNDEKKILYKNVSHHVYEIGEALINPADISSFGGETRPVQMFFLKSWPDAQKVPLDNYCILDLIENSKKWKKLQNATKTPTLVISKNGVGRAGVFCAVSMCLDKLRAEREVDVFNAARTVMENRPQIIENLIEYEYLYTFLASLSDKIVVGVKGSAFSPLAVDVNTPQSTFVPTASQSNSERSNRLSVAKVDTISSQTQNERTTIAPSILKRPSVFSNKTETPDVSNAASDKFTDGKGFLHYAVPVVEEIDDTSLQDDAISCASSFKMDSDILSLDNAEFTIQTYNNNYLQQYSGEDTHYAANTLL